jgi:hypothetical protein
MNFISLQNELTQQQLFENKLREAFQITEEQLRESKSKIATLEEEVMVKRSSNHFMKQQLESTTRALRLNQDELISHQISGSRGSNHTPDPRFTTKRNNSPANRKRSI